MSLDFELRLAARDDRLAEARMSPVCPACGSDDEHPPTCPVRRREEAEDQRREGSAA